MNNIIIMLFLSYLNYTTSYSTYSMSCVIIIKKTVLYDAKMPILYMPNYNKNAIYSDNYNLFTPEHIFPQSLLNTNGKNDMHNIIKTIASLNTNRSNYKYCEDLNINDENWNKLNYNNYVNHKDKLFIPNKDSRGIIARAILYMCREHKCNYKKVIDKELLIKWFYNYSPSIDEKYHNDMVKQIQQTNNIFISKYNKKNNGLYRFINTL